MEHHSNLVPWQLLAHRKGARLRFIPVSPDGLLELENLDTLLDGPVKILAFTHISNTLGTINPAAEICARARRAGVTTLVDAAQSAGHRPLDVRQLDCDFLAFSGHKMCGPTGVGVLYGRKEILQNMEPFHGGGEMIVSVALTQSEFKPRRIALKPARPRLLSHRLGSVRRVSGQHRTPAHFDHDQALAEQAIALLKEVPGMRIFGPGRGRWSGELCA